LIRSRLHLLFVLAAVALWASPALAQDRKPVIREVTLSQTGQPTRKAPLGAVILLQGKNFHSMDAEAEEDDYSHVTVTIDGKDCIVLDVKPDFISLLIPQFDVKPGKRKKLKLKVKGRGSAEVELELVDPEEWKDSNDARAQEMAETGGTVQPDMEERIRRSFQITRFELKRDGGARFEVDGLAGTLPEGFTLSVFLQHELNGRMREIDKRKVRVVKEGQQSKWHAIFGPYSKQLLMGNYVVNILFELGKQGRVRARRFRRGLPDAEKEVYDRIERREFTTVGNQQQVTDQQKLIQGQYRTRGQELAELMGAFEAAYASACRVFFRQPGRAGYDEAQYADYLQRMDIARTADDLKKFKSDSRFATKAGHFRPEEYQKWATDTFMTKLKDIHDEHERFKQRYMAPPDDRADQHVDYMVSVLLNMFQDYSKATYERAKIDYPEVLRSVDINPVSAPEMSKRYFESQHRALLRQIGLEAGDSSGG
jgi:hypothetical protein